MTKHTRSIRGSLLKGVLEGIPSKSFEGIEEAIEKTMRGESGIYALYKKDKLYYVGLARNLKGRVKKHRTDRHAKKWDKFSIYKIKKAKYLGDVEAIILRIFAPKGNSRLGRIPKLRSLQKILEKEAKKKVKESKEKAREAKKKVRESKKLLREAKKLRLDLRKPTKRKRTKRKRIKRKITKRTSRKSTRARTRRKTSRKK